MQNRVSIDWAVLGDTQGAATMGKMLGVDFDQSQGAELKPDSDATKYITHNAKAKLKGVYNPFAGGEPHVKEAIAHDFQTSNRIAVSPERAFAFHHLGRSVIEEAYKVASAGHMSAGVKPYVLLEGLGWGPLTTLAKHNFLNVAFYDPYAPDLKTSIKAAIEKIGAKNVSAIPINRPKNPDSKEADRQEIIDVFTMLDEFNAQPGVDITAIIDMPYGYAAPQLVDTQGRYLKTGFEDVLDDRWKTKWIAVRSGSKEFGAANLGLTFAAASHNYPVNDLICRVTMNGKGITQDKKLINNVATVLADPDFDQMKWENRTNLRNKYVENRQIGQSHFKDYIAPGGSNMLSLYELPSENLLGRKVTGDKYGTWEIENYHHVMEFLAHEFNVAVVGMAYSQRPESTYIRVAQRDKPEKFAEGTQNLVKGLDHIRNGTPIFTPALNH